MPPQRSRYIFPRQGAPSLWNPRREGWISASPKVDVSRLSKPRISHHAAPTLYCFTEKPGYLKVGTNSPFFLSSLLPLRIDIDRLVRAHTLGVADEVGGRLLDPAYPPQNETERGHGDVKRMPLCPKEEQKNPLEAVTSRKVHYTQA